jgi:hypothetical protein
MRWENRRRDGFWLHHLSKRFVHSFGAFVGINLSRHVDESLRLGWIVGSGWWFGFDFVIDHWTNIGRTATAGKRNGKIVSLAGMRAPFPARRMRHYRRLTKTQRSDSNILVVTPLPQVYLRNPAD